MFCLRLLGPVATLFSIKSDRFPQLTVAFYEPNLFAVKARHFLRALLIFPYQLFIIVIFFLLVTFLVVGSCLVGLFDNGSNSTHKCLTYWARACLFLSGLSIYIEGLERLNPESTYVFMANHASFLDILLVFAYVPHNFRIIAKEEVFRIPIMGWILQRSHQIPMDRANPRKGLASLRTAAALLKKGISIVVFPEGTRTTDGAIQEFKATLFILPIRAGVSVVPVLIEGTFHALRRGTFLLNPAPLKMTFHDPICVGALKDRDRWTFARKVQDPLVAAAAPKFD